MENTKSQGVHLELLMQADFKVEQAIAALLEQLYCFLHALQQGPYTEPALPFLLTKMLYALSALQRLHLLKTKLYATMLQGRLAPVLQQRFLGSDAKLEQRLNRAIRSLRAQILQFDPETFPLSLTFLHDLNGFYAQKRSLLPKANLHPSPPWIHPSVRSAAPAHSKKDPCRIQ